ncbi:MAG TPA: hypothetical protein VN678_07595 [Acidobacteriaceae bacterium]|nr:hypothetical protein [Acidobacteriaceae bacterium]
MPLPSLDAARIAASSSSSALVAFWAVAGLVTAKLARHTNTATRENTPDVGLVSSKACL